MHQHRAYDVIHVNIRLNIQGKNVIDLFVYAKFFFFVLKLIMPALRTKEL
jgi:hypothetical protein